MNTLLKIERILFAGILLVAGLFVAMNTLAGTKIYKKVDENGNVVFTDVPPRVEETAETVDLLAPNSFTSGANGDDSAAGDRELWIVDPEDPDAENPGPPPAYRSLAITHPENEANVRENTGNLTVTARLEPELAVGHKIRLLLDDRPWASPKTEPEFALTNVNRGTHRLQAEIIDQNGVVVFSGAPSTFHLQRYSQLTAPNRKPRQPPPPPPRSN